MLTIDGVDDLLTRSGEDLGVSDWITVTQVDVDTFADITGDHQWIHVDPVRAAAGPLGTTIVHGYFTLALCARLQASLYEIVGIGHGLNYGLNRVRFPAPLPVGARMRLRARLSAVEAIPGGAQATITNTYETEGRTKPVCVSDAIVRVYRDEATA